MTYRTSSLIVVLLLLAAGGQPLTGQEPDLGVDSTRLLGEPAGAPLTGDELERVTEEVAGIMRCPVCQGLSIADSPTPLAQAMKSEVRQMLAAGYSPEQVLIYFEQSYGEFIRLAPKAKGFNLLVWVAPLGALLGGLALIVYRLRAASAAASSEAMSSEADLQSYRERVRQEVSS